MCDEMRCRGVLPHAASQCLYHVLKVFLLLFFLMKMLGNFLCYIITPPPLAGCTGAHSVHVSVCDGGAFSAW